MKVIDLSVRNDNTGKIIHLRGDNSNYTTSFENGMTTIENGSIKYIIPSTLGSNIKFNRPDRNSGLKTYSLEELSLLHRDTTPIDSIIGDILDVKPSSVTNTKSIRIGGVNHQVPVIVKENVEIFVNNKSVNSGYTVTNGDYVKFKITAPPTYDTEKTIYLSVGDIAKSFKISTIQ